MGDGVSASSLVETTEILDQQHDLGAFREAVREWTRRIAPPEKSHLWLNAYGDESVEYDRWWMRERAKVGLAIPHWPKAYGGADLSLVHQVIIVDEFSKAQTPDSWSFNVACNHVPATLIPFGSEYQKKKYLPTVPQATIWCQGFSEPGAGSDLAALKTKAVRDGDHYVINGQKIWSSQSMYARYCILLARTDFEVKKQKGITYFLMDMQAPGVEVRPIKKSTGGSSFAELFLTDVRIPVEDRVGEENQGWAIAQATLSAERGVLVFAHVERECISLQKFFDDAVKNKAAWLEDSQLRREFMRLFAEQLALRRMIRELLKESHEGWSMTPGLVKFVSSSLRQRLAEFRVRVSGLKAQVSVPHGGILSDELYAYLDSFGGTIAAGSNEVMRNMIAERGLGMPR
jgi:alkylation response protein AidB-like acyl-CoA dehydrogenase